MAADLGRRQVYFVSLGCPKNQVDTEVMLGQVREGGHELVDDPELADTLVVNTCSFIESAKTESIDTILELAQWKTRDPKKSLVVTGCLSQRYGKELAAELPEVDHFLGSSDMTGLRDILAGSAPRVTISELSRRSYLYDHHTPRVVTGTPHLAYVKISEGCDRPCAFCIIPKLRGPQRSRDIASIVEEAKNLAGRGVQELALVAQDLTAYGDDLTPAATLEHLLDALIRVDGIRWVRLHYAYPSTVTLGLIERIAHEPKIASYLDVPLQHIDTEVLKHMRRGYTEATVRRLVENLRDPKVVGSTRIWLRTTLLVGHPGETPEAYDRLRAFVAEGLIDHLGVFPWSKEEGTVAAMLAKRVPERLARQRADELMAIQAELRLRANQALVGQEIEVLVDGPSEESELVLEGRHEGQAKGIDGKVFLTDGEAKAGDLVRATVTQAEAFDLVATLDPTLHATHATGADHDEIW